MRNNNDLGTNISALGNALGGVISGLLNAVGNVAVGLTSATTNIAGNIANDVIGASDSLVNAVNPNNIPEPRKKECTDSSYYTAQYKALIAEASTDDLIKALDLLVNELRMRIDLMDIESNKQ